MSNVQPSLDPESIRELLSSELRGLQYTISRRIPGRHLHELPPDEFQAAIPSALATWADHVRQIGDEEPGMFYGRWHELFDTTFLDRAVFGRYFGIMVRLSADIVSSDATAGSSARSGLNGRCLVHGGFGYDNVLVEGGKVTAVLDWQDTRFGDPLFDLAHMDF